MSVIPPTPALMALNQALASKPFKPLTPEVARAQVAEHRAEAEAKFYRHPKFARIARRQKWIGQSQSLNLFLPQADLKTLSHRVRAAWKAGLKTTYYLRTLSASNVEKATISVKKDVRITTEEQAPKPTYSESEIKACSLEARARGEECEACQ